MSPMALLSPASHCERIPLRRDECLLPGLWAGVHVASLRDAAVDYFVSAGALFGRFVHAGGPVARALDMPSVAAVGRHHFTTGHAAGE